MTNYNNDSNSPLKKGRLSDVVKPKKRLFTRLTTKTNEEEVIALKSDLVRILAEMGIVLKNTHTICRQLVKKGWVKTKKIEKDTT